MLQLSLSFFKFEFFVSFECDGVRRIKRIDYVYIYIYILADMDINERGYTRFVNVL